MEFSNSGEVNSKSYWDRRFASGDWEDKSGRQQTESFAKGQVSQLGLPSGFNGTLLDFGCGLGDAMPVYREAFPRARLIGVDISSSAIDCCRIHFGGLAEFIQGDYACVPESDVIIASNIVEHLENDKFIINELLARCSLLYVAVPYREMTLCKEHLRAYNENSFIDMKPISWNCFSCPGWSQFGFQLLFHIHLKNCLRILFKRSRRRRDMQILFKFSGHLPPVGILH